MASALTVPWNPAPASRPDPRKSQVTQGLLALQHIQRGELGEARDHTAARGDAHRHPRAETRWSGQSVNPSIEADKQNHAALYKSTFSEHLGLGLDASVLSLAVFHLFNACLIKLLFSAHE